MTLEVNTEKSRVNYPRLHKALSMLYANMKCATLIGIIVHFIDNKAC